jgi:3-deoxy-D-manno-octulosonic-acid transferase
MSPALAAYGLMTALAEPFAPLLLKRRAARGKEDPARLGERLGRAGIARPPCPLVWLHGASVGESLSLLPLIEALARRRPDLTLLVTSGTVAAAQLLALRLPPGAIHQYAPIDAPGAARRFLAHWRPSLAVLVESELWPNLLLRAKAGGARLALIGARISVQTAKGWARAPGAADQLLGAFDLLLAQDGVSRERLEALGGRVDGELDLKQAAAPLPCDEAELSALKAAIGARPVVVAASTHPGEDEMAVSAWRPLPGALLVLVPRHPARADDLAIRLRAMGLRVTRRSAGEPIAPDAGIYLADTLGELGLFLRLAAAVIMGGSLTGGVGGHNPLEPARLGRAVITGPDVANFAQTYAALAAADAVVMAQDQPALDAALAAWLADPDRAAAMGRRAKALADQGDETLNRALAALEPLLPGVWANV